MYEQYFQNFSKQIIFILLNTEYKHIVLDHIELIEINNITSFVNYLSFTDLIKILLKFNNDKIIDIINNFNKSTISRISEFVDYDLNYYGIPEGKTLNLYRIFNDYLNIDLSKKAIDYLK